MRIPLLKNILIITVLLISACASTKPTQQQIASEFWSAMAAKNIDKAKTFAKAGTMDGVSANEGPGIDAINLKPAKIEGSQAYVPTVMSGMKDGQQQTLTFDTVLVEENGTWKVDFDKTTTSMLGFSMQDMMQGMGKAMGEAMTGIGEAVGKGLDGAGAK